MCGRFSFALKKKDVEKALPNVKIKGELQANYNITPTQSAYIITASNPAELQTMRWGLIPHWAKDINKVGTTFNARSEEAAERATFKIPLQQNRCLVLTDGFYEWKSYGKQKIPYRIILKNSPLMIQAGIWDTWTDGKEIIQSFSILTTPPNVEMATIHDRMPLILHNDDLIKSWLSNDYQKVMTSADNNILDMYRISEKLNNIHYNAPDLHNVQNDLLTLF